MPSNQVHNKHGKYTVHVLLRSRSDDILTLEQIIVLNIYIYYIYRGKYPPNRQPWVVNLGRDDPGLTNPNLNPNPNPNRRLGGY